MLEGIDVRVDADYFKFKGLWDQLADKIVFTGKIDEYFNYEFGELEYRTLDFIHERLETENAQGSAMINYPDADVPWTRIVEHKHFTKAKTDFTIVTKEIPAEWDKTKVPYYPINNAANTEIFNTYREKSETLDGVIFGGRLGAYQYMDMHQVIGSAMKAVKKELNV
jgi:UDP-galactopyranose mutase